MCKIGKNCTRGLWEHEGYAPCILDFSIIPVERAPIDSGKDAYRYHEDISNTPVGVHQAGDSVFWAVMLCGLIDHYHCFRGTYFLHLEAKRRRHQVFLKQYLGPVCWQILHGIPEDSNFIVTSVITLNLTCLNLIYNKPLNDWTVRGFIAQ